jgi:hypothetical protein
VSRLTADVIRAGRPRCTVIGLDADPELSRRPSSPAEARFRRHISYLRLEVASIVHSVVFIALLICAFVLGKPQPWTFMFGFTHGVMFAAMVVLVIVAARYRMLPPQVVVAVIVFGAVGPFLGSVWFVRYAGEQPAHAEH